MYNSLLIYGDSFQCPLICGGASYDSPTEALNS